MLNECDTLTGSDKQTDYTQYRLCYSHGCNAYFPLLYISLNHCNVNFVSFAFISLIFRHTEQYERVEWIEFINFLLFSFYLQLKKSFNPTEQRSIVLRWRENILQWNDRFSHIFRFAHTRSATSTAIVFVIFYATIFRLFARIVKCEWEFFRSFIRKEPFNCKYRCISHSIQNPFGSFIYGFN